MGPPSIRFWLKPRHARYRKRSGNAPRRDVAIHTPVTRSGAIAPSASNASGNQSSIPITRCRSTTPGSTSDGPSRSALRPLRSEPSGWDGCLGPDRCSLESIAVFRSAELVWMDARMSAYSAYCDHTGAAQLRVGGRLASELPRANESGEPRRPGWRLLSRKGGSGHAVQSI